MRLRRQLVEFTEQMLQGAVRRSDQRAKGQLYVRGLLTDGARKSMQPMAARLRVDHQGLQQFISSSTWDYEAARRNVARWAVDAVDPAAYVVDDTGFPKDGTASPCVARQYSGTLGKTGNCQIGVSVQMVTDTASLAANWGLFCVVEVEGTASAYPHDATPRLPAGARGRAAYPDKPANLRALAMAAGQQTARTITWRTGTKATVTNPTAAMRSRFLALRVRPANRDIPRTVAGTLPEQWLIVEWPAGANEPTKYWLSNMDTRTPLKTLVRLAKIRWRVEHDYRELKTGLGIDHFEGRSYTGWHRHVTLAVLAQAFCTLLRLDPKAA